MRTIALTLVLLGCSSSDRDDGSSPTPDAGAECDGEIVLDVCVRDDRADPPEPVFTPDDPLTSCACICERIGQIGEPQPGVRTISFLHGARECFGEPDVVYDTFGSSLLTWARGEGDCSEMRQDAGLCECECLCIEVTPGEALDATGDVCDFGTLTTPARQP